MNACRRAFKAGVLDFLSKPVDEQVLLDAIAAAEKALEQVLERAEAQDLLGRLTEREREVLDMVCQGWASKEIATALNVLGTDHRRPPRPYRGEARHELRRRIRAPHARRSRHDV